MDWHVGIQSEILNYTAIKFEQSNSIKQMFEMADISITFSYEHSSGHKCQLQI